MRELHLSFINSFALSLSKSEELPINWLMAVPVTLGPRIQHGISVNVCVFGRGGEWRTSRLALRPCLSSEPHLQCLRPAVYHHHHRHSSSSLRGGGFHCYLLLFLFFVGRGHFSVSFFLHFLACAFVIFFRGVFFFIFLSFHHHHHHCRRRSLLIVIIIMFIIIIIFCHRHYLAFAMQASLLFLSLSHFLGLSLFLHRIA